MKLALSKTISEIDEYCIKELGIPMEELMRRSGHAVANAIRAKVPASSSVIILAGKGNNGGDGYAAACELINEYAVTVIDVFASGQKSEAGRRYLDSFRSMGGKILPFEPSDAISFMIKNSDAIVDAVFGTGFHGEMPELVRPLAIMIRETVEAYKLAVDVPLGINADNGSVSDFAIFVEETVELSYIKPGIISYPARSYVGNIIYDPIGLPIDLLDDIFDFKCTLVNKEWVRETLPPRPENSNKGSFGKLLLITGSEKYRGAAHLTLEAALRGGVGLVSFLGSPKLCSELSVKYPEAIYSEADLTEPDEAMLAHIAELSEKHTATLIGSGSGNTEALLSIVLRLLATEGGPIILDADAINVLAAIGLDGLYAVRDAKRTVILTPHPLEFSRLASMDVATVQLHRLESAERFAKENSCILVLKGAGTITTDGDDIYINVVGSSALAKAGSGDVLAGLIGAFVAAQGGRSPETASAHAVYFHALAGDELAREFSSYGVTPSDLPREIARSIQKFVNKTE